MSLHRRRLGPLLLAMGLFLAPAGAQGGSGGVLATGWNGGEDGDYLKGTGDGVYLLGGARTVYRFRSLRTAGDAALPFSPLWQSFHFTVRDDRNRHRVSFETAVRGSTDFYRGGFRGEVMYAFVELVPAGRWVSLRIGRQLRVNGGAEGLVRFDGISGRMVLHHLLVETYAGAELRSRNFVLIEDSVDQVSHAPSGDWAYGFVLGTSGLKATQVRLGFHDRFRAGQLARRTLTADIHQGIDGRVNLNANLAVDLLNKRLAEVVARVDGRPAPFARVGFEYEHWQARFDADNLFSVFATDPFDALRASGDLRLGQRVQLRASGGVQIQPEAVTQDDVPRPELGRVSGVQHFGLRLLLADGVSLDIAERLVDGNSGTKFGLSITADLEPVARTIVLRLRGDLQRYAFGLQPNLEGWYGGASANLTLQPKPWVRVGLSGEYIFSPWLKGNIQVAATLDFLLGAHVFREKDGAAAMLDRWQPALLAWQQGLPEQGFSGLTGGLGVGGSVR